MENETNEESNTNPSAPSTKLGRKGDPRMHRAVAARLADPDMTLLEALRQGGFAFPAEGGQDSTLVDADGVTLGQRKNQLSRRLRLARQNEDEKERSDKLINELYPGFVRDTVRPFKRNASHLMNQEEDADMSDEMGNIDRLAKYHPQYRAVVPTIHSNITMDPSFMTGHHNTSNVAVASLISTANVVGMTLEQLALSLSNTPALFRVLSSNPSTEAKLNLAMNLYKTDARALLQKCMLLAGYDNSEVMEGHKKYMQVALKAWEIEGKRLERLLGCNKDADRKGELCDCLPGVGSDSMTTEMAVEDATKHFFNMKNSATSHSSIDGTIDSRASSVVDAGGGRHLHRLAGKCGHKAIIHQPSGGPAHIDFVVDGKIECYEGIKPVGPKGQGALWLSRYKCADLSCPTDPEKQQVVCGSESCCSQLQLTEETQAAQPKQLLLTDVDFDGTEWNVDYFSHDGPDDSLLGLMKLSNGDKNTY